LNVVKSYKNIFRQLTLTLVGYFSPWIQSMTRVGYVGSQMAYMWIEIETLALNWRILLLWLETYGNKTCLDMLKGWHSHLNIVIL